MFHKGFFFLFSATFLGLAVASDSTNKVLLFNDALSNVLVSNPEVISSLEKFNMSITDVEISKSGYKPIINLNASTGIHEVDNFGNKVDYNREQVGVSVLQNIFNGFLTEKEVERLKNESAGKYYDYINKVSEIIAETIEVYNNVLKYEELVELANDNYIIHEELYNSMLLRVSSGVGAGVDLELAKGRLALAKSNLSVELSNLHDYKRRLENLTGLSINKIENKDFLFNIGQRVKSDIVLSANNKNPSILSSTEYINSSISEIESQESNYMPKVDLRAKADSGNNVNGLLGRESDASLELIVSYNLYNGGKDSSEKIKSKEKLSFYKEQREIVCRNVKQELSVNYNNFINKKEELSYLSEHVLAVSKSKTAYKQQFNIGQRSLLDLLDIENEYFEVKRKKVKLFYDLKTIESKILHNSGELIDFVGLKPYFSKEVNITPNESNGCFSLNETNESVESYLSKLQKNTVQNNYQPIESNNACGKNINNFIEDWKANWANYQINDYFGFYASDFKGGFKTREEWEESRKRIIMNSKIFSIDVSDLKTENKEGRFFVSFKQSYSSDKLKDVVLKEMELTQENGKCKILTETIRRK